MDNQTIRVLIVDDHSMVRQGIKILLEQFEGIQVIGEAANGQEGIRLVEELNPDLVLMDLTMPVMDGIEATKRIITRQPKQRVLILTGLLDDENLLKAIQAGAQGCIDKTTEPEELVQSIRDVCMGKPSLSAGIAWRILRGMTDTGTPERTKGRLSERELQILRMLTQGKLDHEIADELVLTEVTIRTHISRILTKLGLENRVQAALYGLRTGLVSISETSDVFDNRYR